MSKMSPETFSKLKHIANRFRESKRIDGKTVMSLNEKSGDAALYIYAPIGASWFSEGVTAESVQKALASMRGVSKLDVFINSEGGDVFEAKAIYAQLQRFNAEKVVHIDGIAASAATFVAMAGDRILTAPEATWMIHEAWTVAMGEAGDLRDTADLLDMLNEDIVSIYAKRTGLSADELRTMMSAETWMNAQQAVDKKFSDAIEVFDATKETPDNSATKSQTELIAATTRQRITAMTSSLLEFRARRAAAELPAQPIKKDNRASAVEKNTGKPVK